MNMRKVLLAATAALGLAGIAMSASAAPLGALANAKPEAGATSAVDNVSYRYVRECGGHRWHRHCRYVRVWSPPTVYGFYAGPRHYGHHGHHRRWY
jgi:hypothetical protein